MAKHKTPTAVSTVDPATADDVTLAATLIPSGRKDRRWTVSSTLIDTFANPKMQDKLGSIASALKALGIDVDYIVQAANEAAMALGAMQRLDESAGRVQQRLTELNKRLLGVQTQLLSARRTARSGTPIAAALSGLASLRQKQVTQAKRVRTKAKKAKSKASQASSAK